VSLIFYGVSFKGDQKKELKTKLPESLVVKMIDQYHAQHELIEKKPIQSLDLAKKILPNASVGDLREKLPDILLEIERASKRDLLLVYETITHFRKQPNIILALSDIYNSIPDDRYQARIVVLEVIGELQREDAIEFLKSVIWEALPPITRGPADRITKREYEEMVQGKAVQGMAYIRKDEGDLVAGAVNELLLVLKSHPSHSVRLMAIDAFMWNHSDSKEAASTLYQVLPKDYHKFVERPRFYRGAIQKTFEEHLEAWRKKWIQ